MYLSLVDNQGGGIHIQEEFKRTQIGMFRPIRMDHTNCLQVAIKSIQFNSFTSKSSFSLDGHSHLTKSIGSLFKLTLCDFFVSSKIDKVRVFRKGIHIELFIIKR